MQNLEIADSISCLRAVRNSRASTKREVRALASRVPGVVLTGFQTGDRLAELFANAALFVLPSSHEGMPIALLEAMAHGLPVLASDIVANRQLGLPAGDYFPLGNVDALSSAIAEKIANPRRTRGARADRARRSRL